MIKLIRLIGRGDHSVLTHDEFINHHGSAHLVLFEQCPGGDAVLPRHPPVVGERPHHQIPCIHIVRRLAPAAEIFRGIDLRLDRHDDGVGDFVLHGEHVDQFAIVVLGPDMAAGSGVIELSRDAHTIAALSHAALDDVANAELGGKTYLHGSVEVADGSIKASWSKQSGPGDVTFENADSPITTATFSVPGDYTLRLSAAPVVTTDGLSAADTLHVKVVLPADSAHLEPVDTLAYKIDIAKPGGSRITDLQYGGVAVTADQQFVVAVNNYRQSGGGNFPHVKTAPVVYNRQVEIRQLMIDYVTATGEVDPTTFHTTDWSLTSNGAPIVVNP